MAALLPPISPRAPMVVIESAIQMRTPGRITMTISGMTASAAAIGRPFDASCAREAAATSGRR